MERAAYEVLGGMEESWWYRARAAVVSRLLATSIRTGGAVLDYGAGYGGMYRTLRHFGDVFAFEPDRIACALAAKRGYRAAYSTEDEALSRTYEAVVLCDVLEHIQDDSGALRGIYGSLSSEGKIVLTVPAYQWLWSGFDTEHHHYRRYTRSELVRLLRVAGFDVTYAGYWNTLLFPAALMARLLGKGGKEAFKLPPILDTVLALVLRFERLLMWLVPLPFGLSVVAVGKKRP